VHDPLDLIVFKQTYSPLEHAQGVSPCLQAEQSHSSIVKLITEGRLKILDRSTASLHTCLNFQIGGKQMAEPKHGVEGTLGGKPLSTDAQHKIEALLKTTLEAELKKEHATAGAAAVRRPTHGSVTHGSVEAQ
jgi:hypothetical protein